MTQTRLASLDVFRGITVAAMILVNNPGSWSTVYKPLLHAKWHGCTPTDLVFPFFLFIVGVSIVLAYSKRLEKDIDRKSLLPKIFRRTLTLFGLGLFLHALPDFDIVGIRIPGVLQRIAIVFLGSALIYLYTPPKRLPFVLMGILLLYWFLMQVVPVPDHGTPNLEPETNLGAWLDRLLLSGHLWSQSKTWDPEGLLSTLPALGTGIMGMITGQYLLSKNSPEEKVIQFFLWGAISIVAGLFWGLVFPINKALWTSSYVLYSGGIALQFLAFLYWLVDLKGRDNWTGPFMAYGRNAITAYVASGVVAIYCGFIKVGGTSLKGWLFQNLYASWLPPYLDSLMGALTLVVILWIPLWWMYKKNIIIKV
ncbi:MAG: heparan-alpha-glucosaminide N-acetyltransferase domain-containing protein [Bacteroidota bacterium]